MGVHLAGDLLVELALADGLLLEHGAFIQRPLRTLVEHAGSFTATTQRAGDHLVDRGLPATISGCRRVVIRLERTRNIGSAFNSQYQHST